MRETIEIIDKAIKHITDQAIDINEPLTTMIEEHLTEICNNEEIANKLLNEKKTLKQLNKNIWNTAKQRKQGNCAYIPDAEIYETVEEYYNIIDTEKNTEQRNKDEKDKEQKQTPIMPVPKKTEKNIINIMDLL